MVDTPEPDVVLRAEPHEVGVRLGPRSDLLGIREVGIVNRERDELDSLEDRELQDPVVKLEPMTTVRLRTDGLALLIATLIEPDASACIADSGSDVRPTIRSEGVVVGIVSPRLVSREGDVVVVRDPLTVSRSLPQRYALRTIPARRSCSTWLSRRKRQMRHAQSFSGALG